MTTQKWAQKEKLVKPVSQARGALIEQACCACLHRRWVPTQGIDQPCCSSFNSWRLRKVWCSLGFLYIIQGGILSEVQTYRHLKILNCYFPGSHVSWLGTLWACLCLLLYHQHWSLLSSENELFSKKSITFLGHPKTRCFRDAVTAQVGGSSCCSFFVAVIWHTVYPLKKTVWKNLVRNKNYSFSNIARNHRKWDIYRKSAKLSRLSAEKSICATQRHWTIPWCLLIVLDAINSWE